MDLPNTRITSQRLLDQSQASVYRGKRHIPPHFGHFGPIRVPYPKGLSGCLRGASGDGVRAYACSDMEGRFLQSLALLRAVHNPCQRREMTVSSNNGLVNGPVHNLLMQFLTPGSSKIEVFETYSFDIVTT